MTMIMASSGNCFVILDITDGSIAIAKCMQQLSYVKEILQINVDNLN